MCEGKQGQPVGYHLADTFALVLFLLVVNYRRKEYYGLDIFTPFPLPIHLLKSELQGDGREVIMS